MSGALFILFEAASGYSLFEVIGLDELQQQADAVQQAVSDMNRFGRVVKLTAFLPFSSAADALEQVNAVSEAQMTDELKNFLELNLPKVSNSRCTTACQQLSQSMPEDTRWAMVHLLTPLCEAGEEGRWQEEKEVSAGSIRVQAWQLNPGGIWHPLCLQ